MIAVGLVVRLLEIIVEDQLDSGVTRQEMNVGLKKVFVLVRAKTTSVFSMKMQVSGLVKLLPTAIRMYLMSPVLEPHDPSSGLPPTKK